MYWLQLEVLVDRSDADRWSESLLALGALSVQYLGADAETVLEPAPGETPLWRRLRLRALFDPARSSEDELRLAIAATLGSGEQSALRFGRLVERDWVSEFQASLRPIRVGERLWICPSGTECPQADAIVLRLEPGLAFGSGEHPTTAMCLEWLAAGPPPTRALDYGCGSGILALAAAALGAREVSAVDLDPQALAATAANARANDLAAIHACFPAELPPGQRYDTVVANILSDTLIELAPALTARLAGGGRIALSGILTSQVAAVRAAYAPAVALEITQTRGEWALLAGFVRD